MFIVCPNCDARYEVDDAAIPLEGREVQCTNCSEIWFQERALKLSGPSMTAEDIEQTADDDEVDAELKDSFSKILADAPAPKQPSTPENTQPSQPENTQPTAPKSEMSDDRIADLAQAAIFRSRRMSDTSPETAPEPQSVGQNTSTSPKEPPSTETRAAPSPEVTVSEPLIAPQKPVSGKSVIEILRQEAAYSGGRLTDDDSQGTQAEAPTETRAEPAPQSGAPQQPVELPEQEQPLEKEVAEKSDVAAPEPAAVQAKTVSAPEKSVADILMDRHRAAQNLTNSAESVSDPADVQETTLEEIKDPHTNERRRGKDVFAKVDEIESSLDFEDKAEEIEAKNQLEAETDIPEPLPIGAMERANHFMGGFWAGLVCIALAALLYLFGDWISLRVPSLAESISGYTQTVDAGRQAVQDLYTNGGEPGLANFFKNAYAAFTKS